MNSFQLLLLKIFLNRLGTVSWEPSCSSRAIESTWWKSFWQGVTLITAINITTIKSKTRYFFVTTTSSVFVDKYAKSSGFPVADYNIYPESIPKAVGTSTSKHVRNVVLACLNWCKSQYRHCNTSHDLPWDTLTTHFDVLHSPFFDTTFPPSSERSCLQ